jgi:hypothetical protein
VTAPRARVRIVFLRLLGVVFIVAFASLAVQVRVLWGTHGLLPACDAIRHTGPTLFRFACDDRALLAGATAGMLLGLGLALFVAPRWCLVGCWALYLSFVNVGQEFLWFQWDNLLLETAFFSFFVTPGGWRPRDAGSPHPLGVLLMQWLLFRLMAESGAAKLLTGDPSWRNLTAMATYYETAPLPTWVGWYVHQLPLWAHRVTSAATIAVELFAPLCIWGPRRRRRAAVAIMLGFQVFVTLTGNYGFFNYLSALLCLWALDDHDLGEPEIVARRPSWLATMALAPVVAALVPLSILPFAPFLPWMRPVVRALAPVDEAMEQLRSINSYHLFASMTLVRREPVIEGSNDGTTWKSYELRYEPGDVDRAPPFVAPHQPRLDFQLWFLLLGRHPERYFDTLLDRMLHDPEAVASVFARNPFPDAPPAELRVAIYRYRFSDWRTRRDTGAWWTRELEGHTRPVQR